MAEPNRSNGEPSDAVESVETPAPGTSPYERGPGDPLEHGPAPTHIGPFRLVEVLGQGGMGIVYLAEQREPVSRRVALKVIKLGMDTDEIIGRFKSERQALALMHHPHIAAVLDAGATSQGRLYFVMEHVPGIPITKYCDKHKLGVQERLELFMPVCDAVQHAHLKGVIHRDLKPSNVLVMLQDGKPTPKVIDFGLAKITAAGVDDRTAHTKFGQMLGTAAYMSPEQAEMSGLDIDTRTDVYSLGAMLYELLVGAAPFDHKALQQMSYTERQRVIREVEPQRPSTKISKQGETATKTAEQRHVELRFLVRQLRGDLDWIVLKAMEKDRTRRYATPLELAADLRRHLSHEPVLACPPTFQYRAAKFVRKHRGPVVVAALALLSLITGLIVMTDLYVKATAAKRQADEHRREAEVVNTFLIEDLLAEASPERNPVGSDAVLARILDRAASRLNAVMADQPALEAPLRRTMGRSYAMLGRDADAEPHLRAALHLYQQRHGPADPETLKVMNALVYSLSAQASVRPAKFQEAKSLCHECLQTAERALGPEHTEALKARANSADLLAYEGQHEEAERILRSVLAIRQRATGREEPATLHVMDRLAAELIYLNRHAEAEDMNRQLLAIRERTSGREHPATLNAQHNLALALHSQGKQHEALPLARATLESRKRVLGPDHTHTLRSLETLGNLLYLDGKYAEASGLFEKVVDVAGKRLGLEDDTTIAGMINLANALAGQNKLSEAEPYFVRVLEAYRNRKDTDPLKAIRALGSFAHLLHKQGKLARAEEVYRDALKRRRALPGEGGLDTYFLMNNLASLLLDKEQVEAAAQVEIEELARAALAGRQKLLPAGHRSIGSAMETAGRLLLLQGKPKEAEAKLREAAQLIEKSPREDDWDTAYIDSLIGATLTAQQRFSEAESLLTTACTRLEKSATCPLFRYRQAIERTVALYKQWNKPEQAQAWQAKLR